MEILYKIKKNSLAKGGGTFYNVILKIKDEKAETNQQEANNKVSKKFVYLFSEGNGSMRELLGGKGANLAEMTNLGMPVPQGFTITTEACTQYYQDGRSINAEIQDEIMEYIGKLEEMSGKKFGDLNNPLLVSVRSGAWASMTAWWRPLPRRPGTPASPTTPTAGLSRCTPTWSWRWARSTLRNSSTR